MFYRAILPGALSLAVLLGAAAQDKPKTVKEVMAAAHKGKDSMVARASGGKGTEDDHKKLLEYYEFMATQKPAQGDEASWKAKTAALVAAAKDLVDKKAGAADELKKASDCKGCHSIHKPK